MRLLGRDAKPLGSHAIMESHPFLCCTSFLRKTWLRLRLEFSLKSLIPGLSKIWRDSLTEGDNVLSLDPPCQSQYTHVIHSLINVLDTNNIIAERLAKLRYARGFIFLM